MKHDVQEAQRIMRTAVSSMLRLPWIQEDPFRLVVLLNAATGDALVGILAASGKETDPRARDEYVEKATKIVREEISRAFAEFDRNLSGRRH